MANVLTDLAADLYKAADVVGRELTGVISSSTINGNGSERVALNDVVRSHFTRSATAIDNAPSMTIPEGTDQTVDSKTLSITKSRGVQIPWTGEDIRHVNNGSGFETIYGDQIRQAMRALTNEIEIDLATSAYLGASRAFGTAGTTPFGSNFDEVAELRKILVDNGAPMNDVTMVLNTAAGTKLRNLAQLQKANENGTTELLRNGVLLDLQGIMLKESAGIQLPAVGTGASYLVNNAGGYAIGATAITVDGGTGTILAGDIVTFAGDTNKYVVASALASNVVTLAATGLRKAAADNAAITVTAASTRNVVFHRAALELAIRAPAMPNGGDAAVDAMTIQDPYSGLVFEVRAYKGFQKAMFNVSAAWGTKLWKPEFAAVLLG
jgi:hypothetical protein